MCGAFGSSVHVHVPGGEGNGTGIVWDTQGHIVTNYHVIGAILSTVPKGRRVDEVAKVTMEGPDGKTKTFSATLVGAERSKDLAVLRVNAPSAGPSFHARFRST